MTMDKMTDIQSSTTNLLLNGEVDVAVVPSGSSSQSHDVKQTYYTLPSARFTNIVRLVLFIDGVVSAVLWLTGGTSEYFVDNIVHFHLKESVFDLALMAALKIIFLVPFYSILEDTCYKLIDRPFHKDLQTHSIISRFAVIVLSLGFMAFAATKGGLILYAYLYDASYSLMHVTYNALVISAFCFSLIELLLSLWSFIALRKISSIRRIHRLNARGQEVGEDGKPIRKNVGLIRLASLARPELGILMIAGVALLGSSGAQMVAPLFFGKVVDSAQKSMKELNMTVLILVAIYFVGAIASMIRSWIFVLAGQRLVARLRKHLYAAIIKQEVAFFDTNRTGELCNRLSSDTQVLQSAITLNLSMLLRFSLQILGSIVFMFYLNPALTGVLLAVVPVVSLGAVQYGKFVKKLRKQFQDCLADAGTQAEESLSSVRTVRMFSAETKTQDSYNRDIDKSYQAGKKLAAAQGVFNGAVGIVASGAIGVVLWYGGKLVFENTQNPKVGITSGVLTAFLLYTLQVAVAFGMLSSVYGDFMQAVGASLRIFNLMDRQPEMVESTKALILPQLTGNVEFQNVCFTYPSRPEKQVLTNVSFSVKPGQMVALVGPSGGGKSTIVNLIERFYDPNSGIIYLAGHNLKDFNPRWFRRNISMVSQEPTLFACSIKDNIAYGRDADIEDIREAAKQANADEFVSGFEQGYDTLVGERGVRLSGGQKQRIAIARALIMDPVLLLLDEATSALDAESEHLVQEAVDRAMKGRTVIVIAHRLSTVRNASQVVVIDKGTIAEQGTHEELLAKNGVYKRLVLRQLVTGDEQSNGNQSENKASKLTGSELGTDGGTEQ
ncbi:ABC transporter B family member 25-like [Gigantopelta aegis]|uniref:ABC transporter B family member 25-like n=1 Tax=Gigantopelta aegis TaxID=1735272 RepID=UPI001B88C8A1|nr:ABC transporter B family member 25-like [Gigantopelta aegis]